MPTREEVRPLATPPANSPARFTRDASYPRRRPRAAIAAILALVCLMAGAGVARGETTPAPDPAPSGGAAPPSSGGTAPDPAPVKRPATTAPSTPQRTVQAPASTYHAPITSAAQTTSATTGTRAAAPAGSQPRRTPRTRHRARSHAQHSAKPRPEHPLVSTPVRPEAAVSLLGPLPDAALAVRSAAPRNSSDGLVPAAIALLLVVLAGGSLVRLGAQLPRRAGWG